MQICQGMEQLQSHTETFLLRLHLEQTNASKLCPTQPSRPNCPRFRADWAAQEEAEAAEAAEHCLLGSLCGTPLICSFPSLSVSTRRGCPSRSLSNRRGGVEADCNCTGKPGASCNGVQLTSVKIVNFHRCLRRRRRCVLSVK